MANPVKGDNVKDVFLNNVTNVVQCAEDSVLGVTPNIVTNNTIEGNVRFIESLLDLRLVIDDTLRNNGNSFKAVFSKSETFRKGEKDTLRTLLDRVRNTLEK